MVAFLAALPAVFAAIKGAADLFDMGKQVVEEIKGEPIAAQNPDDLRKEVEGLSTDQQARFIERMNHELAVYEAIGQRLAQQGGFLDSQTLLAIPDKARAHVAMMRMTTRPWAVRWMVIAVVFPPLSIVCINSLIAFYNVVDAAFSTVARPIALIDIAQVLNSLYDQMVGWAAAVIMTYMGMREVGKAVGHKDSVSVADISGSLTRVLGSLKQVWR